MTAPTPTPSAHHSQHLPAAGNTAPTGSKVTGGLAVLACAACCAIPLLIAAGIITGAGAAILEKSLLAGAAGLATLAVTIWWLHRRRAAAAGAGCGCGGTGCGGATPR
ncbi:hypothetical protein ACIBMZ_20590 [Micromonospora sp. NPDC049900]|uniref:hypothetical protein n=1 Tax=Micromonospora sp. NPDC049900 TaxID=3364275 RepID=UPI0037A1D864